MSTLYFHTRDEGTAELRGFEHAHLCQLVRKIAVGTVSLGDGERLKALASKEEAKRIRDPFDIVALDWYRTSLAVNAGGLFTYGGRNLDTFEVVLNTAMALGSDPVRLAARVYAQGDIHAWVDSPNRSWLADVIDEGLDTGVYRRSLNGTSCGWENVTRLLSRSSGGPVVMSYSVSGAFPSERLTDYERDESDASPWDDLTDHQKWDVCMAKLRASGPGHTGLELHPANFKHVRFGHGLSLLDLLAEDYEDRIEAALEGAHP